MSNHLWIGSSFRLCFICCCCVVAYLIFGFYLLILRLDQQTDRSSSKNKKFFFAFDIKKRKTAVVTATAKVVDDKLGNVWCALDQTTHRASSSSLYRRLYIFYCSLFLSMVGVDFQDGRLCDDDGTDFILLASIFSNTWARTTTTTTTTENKVNKTNCHQGN